MFLDLPMQDVHAYQFYLIGDEITTNATTYFLNRTENEFKFAEDSEASSGSRQITWKPVCRASVVTGNTKKCCSMA